MTASAQFEPRAAFFDLDGTLVPAPSLEWRFFSALRRDGKIPLASYCLWLTAALRLLPRGISALQHNNKRYLTGVCRDLTFRYMESIVFFEEGIDRVLWHVRQGHQIVLVSGTLHELAQLAASALECELELRGVQIHLHICATRLAEVRGRWTGYLESEAVYGAEKVRAIESFANQHQLDLRDCHAYGNSLLDRHFLSAVGYAHVVNPGRDLAAIANQKNWPIWHWHLEKPITPPGRTSFVKEIHQIEEQA